MPGSQLLIFSKLWTAFLITICKSFIIVPKLRVGKSLQELVLGKGVIYVLSKGGSSNQKQVKKANCCC